METQEERTNRFNQMSIDKKNGLVECDISCKAKEQPETIEEYKSTLDHYKNHSLLSGCSHGS